MLRLLLVTTVAAACPTKAFAQVLLTNQPLPAESLLAASHDTGKAGLTARILQSGSDNVLRLIQEDRSSVADLEQHGERNAMTVRQSGGENRLSWRQVGSDLPDLKIVQSGAMSLSIVQTAPPR